MLKYHNYNNNNNNPTLTIAQHFNKTCCGQADRQADIEIYRAAITSKKMQKAKYVQMF